MDALQQAMANASTNRQLSDPSAPPVDYIANQPSVDYDYPNNPHTVAIQAKPYEERMRDAYENQGFTPARALPYDTTNEIFKLTTMIEEIRTTIKAASEETTHVKHRSLSQWSFDDILTELIERENDLNPYYFELLKRIGNQDILTQVDGCMNAKMYCTKVLSLICSSMNASVPPVEPTTSLQ